MKYEIDSLRAHGTRVLTPLPPKQRVLSCTWVFTMQIGLTGLVECYKARFVVKGFLQKTWNFFQRSMLQSHPRLALGFSYLPSLIGRCLLGSWILRLPFFLEVCSVAWYALFYIGHVFVPLSPLLSFVWYSVE